jgi:hypothetical protein
MSTSPPDPLDRLKALVEAWISQRDTAARFGCPTGTLAVELDKRADASSTMRRGASSAYCWIGWNAGSAPGPARPR